MAVYYTTNPLDIAATDGLYVVEQTPAPSPTLQGTNVVQVVGDFPWGPVDQKIVLSDTADFEKLLIGKTARPQDWSGVRSIVGKKYAILEVVRILATGAAKASRIIGVDGYKVEAKYYGAAGNEIEVKHTDNADGTLDVEVKWAGYTKSFESVAIADIASLEDDYLVFTAEGDGDTIAASDADYVALTGGSNGAAVDSDYVGGVSSKRGLRILEDSVDGAIVFLAEYTSAAAVTALREFVKEKRARGMIQAADGDFAANLAAATAVLDDRLVMPLHRVYQSINGEEFVVDLAPYVASMLSQMPPHYSIADLDYCKALLGTIIRVAGDVSLKRGSWIAAKKAGGVMLESVPGGGFKFHAGLTTDTSTAKTLISTRGVLDVFVATLVAAISPFQAKPDMEYYDVQILSAGTGAINIMKGRPRSSPETAIIKDAGLQLLPSNEPNEDVLQSAVALHGEKRTIILTITSGINLDVKETLAAA